jgi:hypothetical protein
LENFKISKNDLSYKAELSFPRKKQLLAGRFSLNRPEIIRYIYFYTNTPNSKYRYYGGEGGDCTNFVSQALQAGGWLQVDSYNNHKSDTSWWYKFTYDSWNPLDISENTKSIALTGL